MGMAALDYPERHYLEAANGWIDFGLFDEAEKELKQIPEEICNHPDILDAEWKIRAGLKQWQRALDVSERILSRAPEQIAGWVHRSYSLHELERTQDAMDCLLPAYRKFPSNFIVPYNLACYACQMGDLVNAKTWLERAVKRGDKKIVKKMALADEDLEPLWSEIDRI